MLSFCGPAYSLPGGRCVYDSLLDQSTNTLSAAEFLEALYGQDPPGYLVVWTRQDRMTLCGPAVRHSQAAIKAQDLARSKDVYFGIGLQKAKPPPTKRGTPSRG